MSKESSETRGLTLRELVLELRKDFKKHEHAESVKRAEMYGTLIAIVGILYAAAG